MPDVFAPLKQLESIELVCKTSPASLWSLAGLRSLNLTSRDKVVNVEKLTNLRALEVSPKVKVVGRDKLAQLMEPIPDEDEQHYNHELPPSFGAVRDLHLYGSLTAPLAQLAECTRLETLEFTGRSGVQHLLPFIPPPLRSLRLAFWTALPRLPALRELELIAGETKQIDLGGFTSLRRLTVRCEGAKLIGLAKTKVDTLTLDGCAMPKLDKLAVKKLDVTGMKDLDVNELALPSIVELRVARTAKLGKKVFPSDVWTTSKILQGKMLTRER